MSSKFAPENISVSVTWFNRRGVSTAPTSGMTLEISFRVYGDEIELGLVVSGINTKAHDVRFVEDNWESPVHSFPH